MDKVSIIGGDIWKEAGRKEVFEMAVENFKVVLQATIGLQRKGCATSRAYVAFLSFQKSIKNSLMDASREDCGRFMVIE